MHCNFTTVIKRWFTCLFVAALCWFLLENYWRAVWAVAHGNLKGLLVFGSPGTAGTVSLLLLINSLPEPKHTARPYRKKVPARNLKHTHTVKIAYRYWWGKWDYVFIMSPFKHSSLLFELVHSDTSHRLSVIRMFICPVDQIVHVCMHTCINKPKHNK